MQEHEPIHEERMAILKKRLESLPDFSTHTAELFIAPGAYLAGIRFKEGLTLAKYRTRMMDVPLDRRPLAHHVQHTGDKDFPLVVHGRVTVIENKTFIGQKEVIILP